MNHNFAKVTEDHRIVFAPDTLGRSLRAPYPWQYHQAGYWEVDTTVPSAPEGQYAHPTGKWDLVTVQDEFVPEVYEETCEQVNPNEVYRPPVKVVRQRYEFLPLPPAPPPPPKRYSKMKFVLALAKRGMLAEWDEFAAKTEVMPGLTVGRLFSEATWLQSNDDNFGEVLKAADFVFGTDTINAALDESEDEEW